MIDYFLWWLLLVVQNAAFTWVSRARNSGSIRYHAVASFFSNGIWFASQLILISMAVRPDMGWERLAALGAVYVSGTVAGSLLMHWVSMRYLEKGKRIVGAK